MIALTDQWGPFAPAIEPAELRARLCFPAADCPPSRQVARRGSVPPTAPA